MLLNRWRNVYEYIGVPTSEVGRSANEAEILRIFHGTTEAKRYVY